MANTVELEIIAEVKKATRTIEQFAKQSEKQLGGIKFGVNVAALEAGFNLAERAIRPVLNLIKDGIGEALEAERANTKLAQSMKLVGDFSNAAVDSFNEFADALQATAGIQDDVIKENAALAKSYNLTNAEAKLAVRAAVELSAVTGDDLNTSVRKVSETFNGTLNKSLAKIIPQLRNLTTEQLVSGDAAEIIEKRFGGSAVAVQDTFGGALNKVTVQFGEVLEAIGEFITKNEGLKTLLVDLAGLLGSLASGIKSYREELKNAPKIADALGLDKDKADQMNGIVSSVTKLRDELALNKSSRAALGLPNPSEIKSIEKDIKASQDRLNQATKESREKVAKDLAQFELELAKGNATERQKILIDFEQKALKIRESTEKGSVKQRIQGEELIAKARIDLEKQIAAARQKEIEEITKNPFTLFTNGKAQKPLIDLSEFEQNLVAAGAAFSASVLKGRQGAEDLVAAGVGVAVGAAFGPAFAGPAAELTKILAQGPEAVKAMLNQFVEALPQIQLSLITALLEVIPEFLTTGITKLIDGFVANISPIIEAVIAAIPKIVVALQTQMPRVAFTFGQALIRELPSIVQSFATEFLKIPGQFAKELLAAIPGAGGAVSGVGGFLGGIGDVFGFAEGGKVPDMPQFSNDRFPARLTAGERVLDDGLNRKLEAALDGGGGFGGGQVVVNVMLNQQVLATAIRDLRLGDFRT